MKPPRWAFIVLAAFVGVASSMGHALGAPPAGSGLRSSSPGLRLINVSTTLYFPDIRRSGPCSAAPPNAYAGGPVYQFDQDNPVRPAYNHADKNLALRSYAAVNEFKGFVHYTQDDPTVPPQFATFFSPNRVPAFPAVYRANTWAWQPSPNPGSPGSPITDPPVSVLGLAVTPGEALHVPASGYDIGGGMEVIVLYADADSIALKYTREDSVAPNGYTVHVDGLCTDPNLLALYSQLDAPNGPRYVYRGPADRVTDYNLPSLAAGQVFGVARGAEIQVAIVDSGAFVDPRNCTEWWRIRPGHPNCP